MSTISGTTSTTAITSSTQIRDQYLTLLITQLRNQDPTQPMDNGQMASQLAQLSELEQMENMNGTFTQVLANSQLNYATSLMGKEVSYVPDGQQTTVSGQVQGVSNVGGQVRVIVNGQDVDPDLIQVITNPTSQT
jgi:flagellar basal-body rod modification protein FlgD